MAMPTRSARTTEFGVKAPTPAAIGPGSYLGPTEATVARPSLAPFASSQNRSWQESQSFPGPGPGSYGASAATTSNESEGRPSFWFESRAPRFAPQYTGSTPFVPSTAVQVPGPGTYDASRTPPASSARRRARPGFPKPKTVPGIRKRYNPPSVPRKDQSFGYNVDTEGKLLALPPPVSVRAGDGVDCAGPGDYNPYGNDWWAGNGAAKISKGPRRTVFDEEWAVKDGRPGPGDYDPKLRPRYHLEMPGSAPFMSGVPKCLNRTEGGPGPGQYVKHNPREINKSAGNVPSFSRPAQRGAWLRSDQCPYSEPETMTVPGPGAYGNMDCVSCFVKTERKTLTDERIGFSSTGKRPSPAPLPHNAGMPGPGEYDLSLQSIARTLQHKRRIGCKGVFGRSGDRFQTRKTSEHSAASTPMQLWDQGKVLKRVVVLRPPSKSTCSFKSETSRFQVQSADATPTPTQYVRKDSFDDIVEKGAKSKTKSFLSTSDRREGGAFELKDAGCIPGPGAYNVVTAKVAVPPPRSRSQPKSRLPQGARFMTSTSHGMVGPGSHDITGSLIKKTFNVTFGAACTAGSGRVMHRISCSRRPVPPSGVAGSESPAAAPVASRIFDSVDKEPGLASASPLAVAVTT